MPSLNSKAQRGQLVDRTFSMPSRASDVLSCLLETGKFSDFTMVCGDHEFKLHKSVVCLQSAMMDKALSGEFQEAKTGIMKADEFLPPIIKYMVDFLYKGDYEVIASDLANISLYEEERMPEDDWEVSRGRCELELDNSLERDLSVAQESDLNTFLCHIHMNAAGDYYGIPALQDLSITKLQTLFAENWQPKLYPIIVKAALQKVGDATLHDLLASTAADSIGDLVGDPMFDTLDWQKEFTANILKFCSRKISAGKREKDLSGDQTIECLDNAHGEFFYPKKCEQCGDSVYATLSLGMISDTYRFVCNICKR